MHASWRCDEFFFPFDLFSRSRSLFFKWPFWHLDVLCTHTHTYTQFQQWHTKFICASLTETNNQHSNISTIIFLSTIFPTYDRSDESRTAFDNMLAIKLPTRDAFKYRMGSTFWHKCSSKWHTGYRLWIDSSRNRPDAISTRKLKIIPSQWQN